MEEKLIIPLTPNDFRTLELKIGINQDSFCPYCDGTLISPGQGAFAPGIFYKCPDCGKKFKKTKHIDMTKNEGYFQLKETRGAC